MTIAQLIAALGASGAVGAAISAVVQWLSVRWKQKVDAAEIISKAAIELLDPMRGELEAARAEIRALRQRVADMSQELESAQRELQKRMNGFG